MVKRTILPNSKSVVLLVDSSKFGKFFPYQSIPFEKNDVIISDPLPNDIKIIADKMNIEQIH